MGNKNQLDLIQEKLEQITKIQSYIITLHKKVGNKMSLTPEEIDLFYEYKHKIQSSMTLHNLDYYRNKTDALVTKAKMKNQLDRRKIQQCLILIDKNQKEIINLLNEIKGNS